MNGNHEGHEERFRRQVREDNVMGRIARDDLALLRLVRQMRIQIGADSDARVQDRMGSRA